MTPAFSLSLIYQNIEETMGGNGDAPAACADTAERGIDYLELLVLLVFFIGGQPGE